MKSDSEVNDDALTIRSCILCKSKIIVPYFSDLRRDYLQCKQCHLVFVPPYQRLTQDKELERYSFHQNDPLDSGYNNFLGRMFFALKELIPPDGCGLDFGSGPIPALRDIFTTAGFSMRIFDYFYSRDYSVFDCVYDFITSTEVIEHLYNPDRELKKLWQCLKIGGYFGIMTKLLKNKKQFMQWYYKEDLTHVAFYSIHTLIWLAHSFHSTLTVLADDIVLFKKK